MMHSTIVKTNLVNSCQEGKEIENGTKSVPLCPKPCRPVSSVLDVLKPLRCSKHRYSNLSEEDRTSEILNMLDEKTSVGEETKRFGCKTWCYAGSPPGRTENPLIHDVHFLHQMEILSSRPLSNFSDKFILQ